MALQDYRDPLAYGEEERQILSFVAGQIALAIERKRSQQALLESEEKFRALFEATSTGVMIHDDQQYIEVNPAIVRMLGYGSAAELVGKNPILTSPPLQPGGARTADVARKQIAECLRAGTARFDWVARKADGSDLPVEVILTRIEMGGRQLIQAVVTDITTRKRAEVELWRALEHERELSHLKNNFVSMVSHEFRTPLGIIQSSAEILADYLDQLSADDRREHLGSITRHTQRMGALMEEVLVLGRLDAGKMDFQPAALDLPGFCRRLTDEVLAATDRQCPIQLTVAESAATPGTRADERLLRHIFTNLLSNAVKYSARGQQVEFVVDRDGREAVCEVRDHGIGIPEADQPRLFQAFYRGQNVDQRPGSGLGLVIVKRCLELHGGSIHLESKTGHGTRATVRLPVFGKPA
jgi:PAS domain S-box-containing protein